MQALVFNLLSYPPQAFFVRYKSFSRINIAEFLGIKVSDVAKVFDAQDFIDVLYREALSSLHTHRSSVDIALLDSAKTPGPKGAADRKLYYQLTGAFDRAPKRPDKKTTDLSRQEKETQILGYLSKYGKHLNSKAIIEKGEPIADKPDPSGGQPGIDRSKEPTPGAPE